MVDNAESQPVPLTPSASNKLPVSDYFVEKRVHLDLQIWWVVESNPTTLASTVYDNAAPRSAVISSISCTV